MWLSPSSLLSDCNVKNTEICRTGIGHFSWNAVSFRRVAGVYHTRGCRCIPGGLHVKNTSLQNELICGLYLNISVNIYTID